MRDPRDRFDPRHRPEDPRDIARRELRSGEKLIWADRPAPAVHRKRGMSRFLFGIPFTAFACFWIWGAGQGFGQSLMGSVFPFFGLPFLLAGIWMLLSPLRAEKMAQSTVYAVTDQRLFISSGGKSRKVQSYGPRDITKVERNEHDDGLGDVVFGEEVSWRSGNNRFGVRMGFGGRMNDRTYIQDVGFFGITDAREVEAEVVKLRRSEVAFSGASA